MLYRGIHFRFRLPRNQLENISRLNKLRKNSLTISQN